MLFKSSNSFLSLQNLLSLPVLIALCLLPHSKNALSVEHGVQVEPDTRSGLENADNAFPERNESEKVHLPLSKAIESQTIARDFQPSLGQNRAGLEAIEILPTGANASTPKVQTENTDVGLSPDTSLPAMPASATSLFSTGSKAEEDRATLGIDGEDATNPPTSATVNSADFEPLFRDFVSSEPKPKPETSEEAEDPRVLISEVVVSATDGNLNEELTDTAYRAIQTEPGRTTTQSQLQEDINAIFATGFFSNVRVFADDTPLGVRVTFLVQANPVLTAVQIEGNDVLEQFVVDETFQEQYGEILNLKRLQQGIENLNQWYKDKGYVLAQVVDAPQVSEDGVVTLEVAEGVVESIQIRFFDEEDEVEKGRTREFVITREMSLKSGDVFNREAVQKDLQRIFRLGLFEDVQLSLDPAEEDPNQVVVTVNVDERNPVSISAGLGYSSLKSVFFSTSYTQRNLLGRAQKLEIEAKFSIQGTKVTGSLNSPGNLEELPVQGIFKDIGFQRHALAATNALSNLELSNALAYSSKLLELSRETNSKTLEALIINNLASIHEYKGNPRLALEACKDVMSILKTLESPALELSILLKQAKLYRKLDEPRKAIEKYTQALEMLKVIQQGKEFRSLLGEDFFKLLSDEWKFEDKGLERGKRSIFSLIQLGILLDLASTYSVLGDYQAGIYTINDRSLIASADSLSQDISNFINDKDALLSLFNDVSESDFETSFPKSLIETFEISRDTALSLVNTLSKNYELQALKFIFSDLNESYLRDFYEERIQEVTQIQEKEINSFFYAFSLMLTDETFLNAFWKNFMSQNGRDLNVDSAYRRYLLRLGELLPEAFDLDNQSWKKEGVRKIFEIIADEFYAYLKKTNILEDLRIFGGVQAEINLPSGLPTDREFRDSRSTDLGQDRILIDQFLNLLSEIIPEIFSDSSVGDDSPASDIRKIELIQQILENWPTESELLRKFEWSKGFLFKFQGDKYYKLGNHEAALEVYDPAIGLLRKGDLFLKSYLSSEELQGTLFDSLAPMLQEFMTVQIFDANLNSADLNLMLQNPEKAKFLYYATLDLTQHLPAKSLIFKQSERAEIYYGIAQTELMLSNAVLAQEAIEEAIAINESSFPNESVAGRTAVTSLNLIYGYGIPYQGSISGQFDFGSTSNIGFQSIPGIGLVPIASNGDSIERRCSTIAKYFSCRQKYFELYISFLLGKHQADPSAGFDILAFEASEKARELDFGKAQTNQLGTAPEESEQKLSFRQIRKVIDNDTILLEFFLGEAKSYLWLVESDGRIQVYDNLPPRHVIEAKAREFYDLLTSPVGRVRPQTTAAVGQELSEMLFGNVASQLGTKRLVIIADGFLQYLPFGVLPNPAPDESPDGEALKGEYAPVLTPLLLEHEIVYLPSASSLVDLRQEAASQPKPTQELAFFANPIFNHKDSRVNQVKLFAGSEPFSAADLLDVEVLHSQLPETERELEAILDAKLIPKDQIQEFFGYEADLETALSPEIGRFRIVHFASHGIFNSNAPERSGIVLSGINEGGVVQPGLLSPAYAFNEMDLSATELVVLSGCRTGLSSGQIGREGMTGLTSGLLQAGADRVVASLWSVRDDATRELMKRFYQRMLDPVAPMRPAAALREAQISMWNEPKWQTPYYWAAFTLQGEWR